MPLRPVDKREVAFRRTGEKEFGIPGADGYGASPIAGEPSQRVFVSRSVDS
jgi:hypothetical protein